MSKTVPPIAKLLDPTADYCKHIAGIMTKLIKNLTLYWYKVFRALGCPPVDALRMAREEVQIDVNKIDLSVNFDGPMQR